ncbi:hypothetical protein R3P38DRAFT_3575915 [Favolaschia claudopus]|uniref:Uncharacterized protein n=1 Tax=Favolaschia claudopus TaxID=2862362 RepID=A0AAW0AK84_9AGAR
MSQPSSSPLPTFLQRSALATHSAPVTREFAPIYNNLPEITARDPLGLLPYRRRIQATKGLVLEWDNEKKCEYVAACAEGICKYWILLERMYPKRSQPVREYPLRDTTGQPPIELRDIHRFLPSSAATTPSNLLQVPGVRRCVALAPQTLVLAPSSVLVDPALAVLLAGHPAKLESPFAMLMQLDASSNAGLTEAEFRKLFVRCLDSFEDHNCRLISASTEVIGLTSD